jgi:hypothetical protein
MIEKCRTHEHRYRHLENTYHDIMIEDFEGKIRHYKRIDLFYCERCLDYVTVTKEDWLTKQPDWYQL